MAVLGRGGVPGGVLVGVVGHAGVPGQVWERGLRAVGEIVLERTDKVVSTVEVYMLLGVGVRIDKLVEVVKLVLMEVGKVSLVLSLRGSKKFSTVML